MKIISKLIFLFLPSIISTTIHAAEMIHLFNTPLQQFSQFGSDTTFKTQSSAIDLNHMHHTRMKQMYLDYPVWGGDIIKHNTTINGIFYTRLHDDLTASPQIAFTVQHQKDTWNDAFHHWQHSHTTLFITKEKIKHIVTPLIYIDKDRHAHWAYHVSFFINIPDNIPQNPNYIIDALNHSFYETWDNTQTISDTFAGGLGGNEKVGKYIYDGSLIHLPTLTIQRDDNKKLCYLKNNDVTVIDDREDQYQSFFPCEKTDPSHGNLYWDSDFDAANGAYSPSNDALYIGKIVKNMYFDWYHIPVLIADNHPMMLKMIVHSHMDNAYWSGSKMVFGDGIRDFYPLVSLGVGAHEISHGFTQQHSGLVYDGESGGINESFSDIASSAAIYYATNKMHWQIGDDILKKKNKALRYFDSPTQDCEGKHPGNNCSIENVADYFAGLDVHYSSGIFNKFFYLLSTQPNWDIHKTFNLFVKANRDYWIPLSDFEDAACGIIQSARDLNYSLSEIKEAFHKVGIAAQC